MYASLYVHGCRIGTAELTYEASELPEPPEATLSLGCAQIGRVAVYHRSTVPAEVNLVWAWLYAVELTELKLRLARVWRVVGARRVRRRLRKKIVRLRRALAQLGAKEHE